MTIVALCMNGYWRTGSRNSAVTPTSRINRLRTIDRIGRHALVRAHVRSRLDGWQLTLVHGPPSVDEAFTPPFIEELFHWVDGAEAVFPPRAPPAGQRRELTMNGEEGTGA